MFKYLFVFLLIFQYSKGNAQTNINLRSIILNDTTTHIANHVAHNSQHFFMLNVKDNVTAEYRNKIVKTDSDFNILNIDQEFDINGEIFNSISFFEIIDDELMLISNTQEDSGNKLFTHKYNLNLDYHTIIDSIALGNDYFATTLKNGLSKDFDDQGYIAFGNRYDTFSGSFGPINVLKIDDDFNIVDLQEINSEFYAVFEAEILQQSKQYLISIWGRGMYLLNEKLDFIDTLYVGPTDGFESIFCEERDNNLYSCISYKRTTDEQAISSIDYEIIENKIEISNITPLNISDSIVVDKNIHQAIVHKDSENRLNIAYAENWHPGHPNDLSNSIYFKRFDTDKNLDIDLKIEGNGEYVISTVKTDQNENIIITGFYYPQTSNINSIRNFYVVIDDNGKIISNTNSPVNISSFEIFPNPAVDEIWIDIDGIKDFAPYQIYTLDGKLITSGNLVDGALSKLDITSYAKGMYVVQILTDDKIYVGKFVKG